MKTAEEAAKEYIDGLYKPLNDYTGVEKRLMTNAYIAGFESRQGGWVSVNERPPSSTTLLCAYTNAMGSAHMGYFVGFFSEGEYYEEETENRWKNALFPIYAWQRVQLPKLPQPPTATNS
jgi:hypothetical protein